MHSAVSAASAAGGDQRLSWPTGTATLLGGLLLALFYLAHAARVLGIVDGQPGPISLSLFLVETAGLLLLLLSLPGWCSPVASMSPLAIIGAVSLAIGLLIWALAAASNFAPDGQLAIPLPTWLYTALVALGSPIFAATRLRARAVPLGAILLVGVGVPLGMMLLATPEWASALGVDIVWPLSPLPGQLVLALYAVGWSWAGVDHRRRFVRARGL